MYVKKFIAVLTLMSVMMSAVGCQGRNGDSSLSENESSVVVNEETGTKLKNFMTQKELDRVKVGKLTLLDDDVQDTQTESTGRVQVYIGTADDLRKSTEDCKDLGLITQEEYEESIRNNAELDSDFRYIDMAFVDGRWIYNHFPEYDYDGGEVYWVTQDNEVQEKLILHNFDEVKNYIKESISKEAEFYNDDTLFDSEQVYEDTVALWQSVIDGTYEEITKEEAEKLRDESIYNVAFDGDYKDVWEYDLSEVEEIKDFIKEISIYDEELDTEFLVHVTLPPDFDESKTYPMFVFSDGVWRFGNVPSIRKLMENGEIQDIILVTIGYSYKINGTDEQVRSRYFYQKTEKTCDFIVDNLMPYLSEMYNIDCEHSGFYGHSAGGVLSHYAVFNSDKYENQPFRYYIIGSPALWELHRVDGKQNPDACYDEYGYWERNDTLDKVLFVCGGENEDPEYEEYYDEYPTTLEGISGLMERLESHGVETAECKIYEDSGHWQFIPDMFIEFFRKYYGNQSE
ncbi:MAG: alpha/beta hydrolase [Ruminococcus sp.]|nr:alpha/beta hydrolase [Ruminococcus sp.]